MTDTETMTIKSGYQLSYDLLRHIDNQYKKDRLKPSNNHFYRDEFYIRLNFIRAMSVVVARTVNKKLFHEQNR